jgi:uncharacterized protein (DUF169 family)
VLPFDIVGCIVSQDAFTELLRLTSSPVAIAFVDQPPHGIERASRSGPASCDYWRQAAEGRTFFTLPEDHTSCPIGAHTHHVTTSPENQQQLIGFIHHMVGLSYIKMEDVLSIPRRATPLSVAVYGPLASTTWPADVVLIRGNARQLMLVTEAAQHAGMAGVGPVMGRPTCAVLPTAIHTQAVTANFGCIGNRVYTGASENEAYVAVPGNTLDTLIESLRTIVNANNALEQFHRQRTIQ